MTSNVDHSKDEVDDEGERDLIDTAEDVSEHFEVVGRAGWVAKGLVYALIGVLFIRIAFNAADVDEANQAGAIESIAEQPFGRVLLIALGFGLLLYAMWRLFTVVLPGDWTGKALLDRLGYMVSTIVYLSLLITIGSAVVNARSDSDEREDRVIEGLVKDVLSVTAGRTLVIIAGLAVVAVGVIFVRKGWTKSFRDQMQCDAEFEGTVIDRLGVIGWSARGVSMAIIGFFLIRAAWMFDPDEAAGLDDSMRQIASHPAGAVLSVAVGIGFIAYGAFAGLSARHRILEGPRND